MQTAAAPEPLIAIIDDDEPMRVALIGLIRAMGYRALGFASAEDFLSDQGREGVACIVTDIHMPGLSGIDLAERLGGVGAALPLIMITARAEPELRARALASGALCVLKKPFAADDFVACLRRALGEA